MPLKTHLDEQPSLNLTPMIDVVFLLIIFFMVGTRFTEPERKFGLKLPEVPQRGALTAAPERRVVAVYPDGVITLDRNRVTLADLTRQLAASRAQYSDLGVLIRGDARCEHQHIVDVLNACEKAGIKELGISARVLPRKE